MTHMITYAHSQVHFVSVKMAEFGYQCQFVSEVSDDLLCGACQRVAREPHITDCCGGHCCRACIDRIKEDRYPCPSCDQAQFTNDLDKEMHKRILALQVYCTMKGCGCEWEGQLEDLQAHLDVDANDCQHVDVVCSNKCGQSVPRLLVPSHLADSCPNREIRHLQPHQESTPPVSFTIDNFSKLKADGKTWTSPDFYTHEQGYKIYVMVDPDYCGHVVSGVGLRVWAKPGEHDAWLKWPARASFTIQLLNQHRDHAHLTRETGVVVWGRPTGDKHIAGWAPFISSSDLDWNTDKQTQYLKNDCLIFRLANVELK